MSVKCLQWLPQNVAVGSLFASVRPDGPDGSEQQTHTDVTESTDRYCRQTDKQAEADAREHTARSGTV